MIINRKKAEGLNELNNLLKDVKSRTVVLFTGSTSDGQNWCSDCIKAEPVIEKVIEEMTTPGVADTDITFIECAVGLRPEWKDKTNAFRTDERFKLKEIPTLLDYSNKAKNLSGEQCANELLVKELFLDD